MNEADKAKLTNPRARAIANMDGHQRDAKVKVLLQAEIDKKSPPPEPIPETPDEAL